ncbi:MAG: hypothetical protein JOZ16_04585 [Methylobacteriaceae bacterium]|nr:hypothetical protein [Methylobacteriaceae bacterium]
MSRPYSIIFAVAALLVSACSRPDANLQRQVRVLQAELAETQAKLEQVEKADAAASNAQMAQDCCGAQDDSGGDVLPGNEAGYQKPGVHPLKPPPPSKQSAPDLSAEP